MASTDTIRIAAMGDAMLGRSVGARYEARPDDFAMADIRGVVDGHDIVFVNLECPVSSRGRPDPIQKPNVTFCAPPATIQILKGLGVNVVSVGNNHALDYGVEALEDTLSHLTAAGIQWGGAGRDYAEANAPICLEVNGQRVAILSHVFIYSASTRMAADQQPGVADHRIERILPTISQLRRNGYIVIVSAHWGLEYAFHPIPYQRRQARQMIEAGASLILGHGPHYPQGFETHKHGRIVYSLGNILFDEPYPYSNRSFIYSVALSRTAGSVVEEQITPVRIVGGVPRIMTGHDGQRLRRALDALTRGYQAASRKQQRKISARYLSDIVNRVLTMKSLRFLFLPPLSFYRDVGLTGIAQKMRIRNLFGIFRKVWN
jgi:poly-gamma-glutamate capsule biosynthesis protein CapA/YwtB (metallophosphatase superfamily)